MEDESCWDGLLPATLEGEVRGYITVSCQFKGGSLDPFRVQNQGLFALVENRAEM